jgi:hypothetical protein
MVSPDVVAVMLTLVGLTSLQIRADGAQSKSLPGAPGNREETGRVRE